jgi:hypothetical protein
MLKPLAKFWNLVPYVVVEWDHVRRHHFPNVRLRTYLCNIEYNNLAVEKYAN